MKKLLLINLLALSGSLVLAGDLTYGWNQQKNTDVILQVGKQAKSSSIVLKSVIVHSNGRKCANNEAATQTSNTLSNTLNLNECFQITQRVKLVGVSDLPNSLAILQKNPDYMTKKDSKLTITSDQVIRKDLEVTVNYTKNGNTSKRNSKFSLLFIKD
ncbi:MAG: hypothetical protein K0R14_1914 [Burkholderiales bacterium]|jgi:hydroxymethylpyrimidine/phosphomethylpyrimidine kinase|nr:hypothetical protein [Burkholderiales bacterium]